jgi:hypothetical protein
MLRDAASMGKRRIRLCYGAALLLASVIIVLAVIACTNMTAAVGYEAVAFFTSMPANDDALSEWLRRQPGVIAHSVEVSRHDEALEVAFIQSRNLCGRPRLPNLDAQVDALGYEGSTSFRDRR